MKLIDRCDFIDRNEEYIIVSLNDIDICQLKRKGNFIYTLKCLNGMTVYKTDVNNFLGYRNLTPEEYSDVIEFVRKEITDKPKRKRGKQT